MKKILFLLLLTTSINAQNIEVSGGISKSIFDLTTLERFHSDDGSYSIKHHLLPEPYYSYNFNVGVEYINKKYFSLVSNIGVIKRGGVNTNNEHGVSPRTSKNNEVVLETVTINTLARLKATNKYFTLFIGAGPRIDYMYNIDGHTWDEKPVDELINIINYGIDIESGINFTFSNFIIGLKVIRNIIMRDVYLNLERHQSQNIYTNSVNLTLGYKL